jgi:cytochrome c553
MVNEAFAQGLRQNDIFGQMRVIAKMLRADEMQALAAFYGANAAPQTTIVVGAR